MKHDFNTVPADLPLREKLPKLTEITREKLMAWGMAQPAARPWVMQRAAAYFDAGQKELAALDAWCCLDLLRWQRDTSDDRTAVAWLDDHAKLTTKE